MISFWLQAIWLLCLGWAVIYVIVSPRQAADRVTPGDLLGFSVLIGIPLAAMRWLQ